MIFLGVNGFVHVPHTQLIQSRLIIIIYIFNMDVVLYGWGILNY